jgi:hypothetical protein
LEINKCFLGWSNQVNDNGTVLNNITGTQVDVMNNYTFEVEISDHDSVEPNISYIKNVTLVAYVNFEGDPTAYHPSHPTALYDKRNYEFQFNASRLNGGGDKQSNWEMKINYPMGQNEVVLHWDNTTWIDETDNFDSDGVNDTITFRWAFHLGNQTRNTNSSGAFQADDWVFYAVAIDTFGIVNSSQGAFQQDFDVFQKTWIFANGDVAGRDVPGGGPFLLSTGPNLDHLVEFAANNNATFSINATNLTGTWVSSTLRVATEDLGIGHANWTSIGPDFVYLAECPHAYNGTKSVNAAPVGFNENGHLWWMCDGIPAGTPSGQYQSTVTIKISITGT